MTRGSRPRTTDVSLPTPDMDLPAGRCVHHARWTLCYLSRMPDERLDLFDDYSESGFDGKYERWDRSWLVVDKEKRTVTLEVEVEKRTFPDGPERKTSTRYQLKVGELVALIEKHGTRLT